MVLFKRKSKRRVCVVGLDGVPYELLLKLTTEGLMPATAEIIEGGHLRRMKVTLPEISSVSWTSFMTGTNPGTHGIFGFVDLKPNSYHIRFPSFKDLKAPTIWDKLGKRGKRCIVINQPATYPASPINGVLIAGFVAIELEKAIAPTSYLPRLRRLGYQIDIDTLRARQDHDFLFQELDRTLEARHRVVDYLWEEDWDYFQLVVTGTDRLQHFVWEGIEDEDHPYHQPIIKYYREVDRLLGELYGRFSRATDGEGFFLLSDHGFTAIKQEVYLNSWLREEGYLKFKVPNPSSLEDIKEGTVAFALDPNRIYLNRRGRFPRGILGEGELSALREELRRKLEGLQHQGEPVVERVFLGEELYSGPWVDMGPDLVILSRYGYDMKGSVKEREVFGRTGLQGMHTWDNAFFFSKEEIEGGALHITDLSEKIIGLFD